MKRTSVFCHMFLFLTGFISLIGCATTTTPTITSPATSTNPTPGPAPISAPTPPPAPAPTPAPTSTPSPTPLPMPQNATVYVEDDAHSDFYRILVYPASATGLTDFTFAMGDPNHSLSKVSVDFAGNIYVLSSNFKTNDQAILEYSSTAPFGAPLRSLPVGPGTKIPAVWGLSVNPAGEIFVADGTGLSVFSAKANGNDDPVRHITGSFLQRTASSPYIYALTVDTNDNVYVVNGSDTPIVVFGSTADGNAGPIRALGGDLTQLDGGYIGGITTDSNGNLYVACVCTRLFGVLEFGPSANGNTAPIRTIAGPLTGLYPYFASLGVAVDSAGYLYVNAIKANATSQYSLPAIFKFSPVAIGNAAPDSVVTLSGWYDSEEPQIAVH